MSQQEFKAKCIEAIKEFHDPKQDGPLLVSTREMSSYSPTHDDWEEPFIEYAAAIGHWPVGYLGESAFEFDQFADDIIKVLVRRAKELHQERQTEPETEHADPERAKYDALLD